VDNLLGTLRTLGPVKLAVVVAVTAAVIGLLYAFTARFTQPDMTLLYGELDLTEASEIASRLEGMGVPYTLTGDGTQILVPADVALRMRMALAEDGLPSGGSIGYEIFDKTDALSGGRAMMDVNLVRALEGELARTIRTFSLVQAARVHLVMPKRELFSQDRQEPTASIIVKVRGGNRLSAGQVAAIRQVVAAAVPGLSTERVSIVDDKGTLLARGDGDDVAGAVAAAGEDYRAALEGRLKQQVEDLLAQSLGVGKVRAQVSAEIDFDRITTSSEEYDPDGQVIRSTQTVEDGSSSSEGGAAAGVSVQNELPEAAAPAAGGAGASKTSNRTEETVNYEISKTVRNHVTEAGSIKRLSVAVLVDGVTTAAADGTQTYQPRSPEEIEQIAALVRSAVGFDAERGDTVEVVNMPFTHEPAEELAEDAGPPLGLVKSDFMRIGEMAAMIVVALLISLLVLRPLMSHAFRAAPAAAGAAAGSGGAAVAQLAPGQAPATALPPAAAAPAQPTQPEAMIDVERVDGRVRESAITKVGEIVDKHPDETLNIIRNWMYEEA